MSISSPTEALKASKVIVSHEPLSAIPPVEKIRDLYNSSKLKRNISIRYPCCDIRCKALV